MIGRCGRSTRQDCKFFRRKVRSGQMPWPDGSAGQDLPQYIRHSHNGSTVSDWPGLTTSISGGMTAIPMASAMGDIEAEAPCPSRTKTGRPKASRESHLTGTYSRRPVART